MRKIKGFIDYGVDVVVKFGGSLLAQPEHARRATAALAACAAADRRLLVVPGGGPTDKAIEALDRHHHFAPDTHHRACARAQDQTGLMICDPAFGNALTPCETLEEARAALDGGRVAVILPSRIIADLDPFERTWEITSDAMAAWFAWLIGADRLVILTNVDGVYPPGHPTFSGPPLREVRASDLESWGLTSVDACVPPFIRRHGIETWVLHGGFPERLAELLNSVPTIGTRIIPE